MQIKRYIFPTLWPVLGLCAAVLVARRAVAPTRAASRAAAAPAPIQSSVVKVFATMRYPDPFKPWTKQAPSEVSASGVVIEGKRILTNAHVVLYATQVQVQANAEGDKVAATVVAVAPGIDLAVLQLEDPAFFDTHPAIARASELPQIKDAVLAYGFPTGRHFALDYQRHRVAHRIRRVQLSGLGAAHSDRRGDQSRQQRRPGHRGRQDDRPRLQQAGRRYVKISATSSPTRRSISFSRTSPTGATTASPPCTTICRRSRTRRCASTSSSTNPSPAWSCTSPTRPTPAIRSRNGT